MLTILLALACTGKPPDPVDDTGPPDRGAPTATFPSFYGKVPKNLLMVSIDTFRRDLLVRNGGGGDAAFLDRMAEEGVSLDAHRTCSNWTFPSIMCVVHGATNVEVGFVPDLRNPGAAQMPETTPTLALRLQDAGFRTMLVTSNSWFSDEHNSDYGYDSSERPTDRRTTAVFEQGIDRLQQAREEGVDRWYLHLHVKEPHPAYAPPESYLAGLADLPEIPYDFTDSDVLYDMHDVWPEMTEEERALVLQHLLVRYHGEVRWLSDQLIEQFANLDRAGFLEDTLVVFWTDHGEQFWEHGEQTHAYGLHNEENDAVAIFWAKNIVAGTWTEPTSHVDLAPTVLSLLGVDDTVGFTGLPVGEAAPDRDLHYATVARHGVVQSVVQDGWKLIYRWETGEKWAFDTVNDPLELDDRYAPSDARIQGLEGLLAPKVEAMRALAPRHTPM
ncbi:MAG: sulfatase-like hydrolase/transferase [Myxococcota bacterium]